MLTRSELEHIAQVCSVIADEVADKDGFVPMHALVERFHVSLVFRPLLVEGMLATTRGWESNASARWAVMIDAETHPVSDDEVAKESSVSPLSSRLRNTIAHELVHSLAFRPTEFGIKLAVPGGKNVGAEKLVDAIERETERFSPLLLLPEKALRQFLNTKETSLTLNEVLTLRRLMGVSRPVLVSRLGLLQAQMSNLLSLPALNNFGIGLAEWTIGGKSVVRKWPLFAQFEKNLIPSLFRRASSQDRLPADLIFQDSSFAMCGGVNDVAELHLPIGTQSAPTSGSMRVQISAEMQGRKIGSEFLFVVRKSEQ